MKLRKVKVFDWKPVPGKTHYEKVFDYNALFHEFGVCYEESDTGFGNYSAAIVEKLDGSVEVVPADLIQFVEAFK